MLGDRQREATKGVVMGIPHGNPSLEEVSSILWML